MELLIFLVRHKDRLVGREEIVEKIWGKDVFLDTEQGINTAVRKIRLALRDDAEQPHYLQTVVGRGYRFVGPITVTADNGSGGIDTPKEPSPQISEPATPLISSSPRRFGFRTAWASVGAVLVLALLVWANVFGLR